MVAVPSALAEVIDVLDETGWAAEVTDADWRVVWASQISMQCASKSPVTPDPAAFTSSRQRPAPPWGRSALMVQSWRKLAR